MDVPQILLLPLILSLLCLASSNANANANANAGEVNILMEIKASLDPHNTRLSSWDPHTSNHCSSFEGVACGVHGRVVNISLQGKGLVGTLPPAIALLRSLSGLYLHFNMLSGEIPSDLANLTSLSDLYLNVNNFTGPIPHQIANLSSLQVLQLCYNNLSGNLPTQLGSLKNLSVLAVQSNSLTGAIPASLGDLGMLTRLDLSFNKLFGSVPVKLAQASMLQVLDIRNNSLSGSVPSALKRLDSGFRYDNNLDLCGEAFASLRTCTSADKVNGNTVLPEPFAPASAGVATKNLPEPVNLQSNCSRIQCSGRAAHSRVGVVCGLVVAVLVVSVAGLSVFSWYRRYKQKIGSALEASDGRLSTDLGKEFCRRSPSPLINLEYSNGWDPLAKGSQEAIQSFMFNLEDVERATQHFAQVYLLGKSNYSAIYKGILRDGSAVAIKCIAKTSCKSDEAEFLKGLKILTSLKHENLVQLRGFCCSKGRGECFLLYDFVPKGNLVEYLDLKVSDEKVLEWSARVSVVKGIAKGIGYLHAEQDNKPAIAHQSISADKVLIDKQMKPLLSGSGVHKLLADDIVFSTLKASAAMGYLAPEYTTTGRFTDKSDIYAFGVLVFQVLTGKSKICQVNFQGPEPCRLQDFIDENLNGRFLEPEAAKLCEIALLCTHELPYRRPNINSVIEELNLLS